MVNVIRGKEGKSCTTQFTTKRRGEIRRIITTINVDFLISMSAQVGKSFYLCCPLCPQGPQQFLTHGEF